MAWVEATEQNGCGACQAKSACALSGPLSGLSRFFSSRRQPIPVRADAAVPGQECTVVMDEADFLKVGLLAYLIPTLLAVAGASGATWTGAGDVGAVLGLLLGFAAGLLLAARLACTPPMTVRPDPLSSPQGDTP
jgi:sigma-E factor negative regulatory protein RseC